MRHGTKRNRKGSIIAGRGHQAPGFSRSSERIDLPVSLHQAVDAQIVGLTHNGEGVGRTASGFTLFIAGALPGEAVRARVTEVKRKYGRAELMSVPTVSADRVVAPCEVFARCGGCQLQHLSYDAQLRWKRQQVVDALERIGKLHVVQAPAGTSPHGGSEEAGVTSLADRGVVVHPVIGMDEPWRYRNKVQLPIGFDVTEGGLIGGFYGAGTHRIVETESCLIQHERNDAAVLQVKRIARELGIEAYHEPSHTGWLRHVIAKVSFATGELMIVLVATARETPHLDAFIESIRHELAHVVSLCLNINPARTSEIFGEETVTLWGADTIEDEIGGIRFAISARSFFQVNPVQTLRLYQTALDYAALTGSETVIDAYCGIGTISLFLARAARHVYGVELIPDAITDARANAQRNGIDNADFVTGRAEAVLPAWRAQGIDADVIVVDPPRKGCDPALLDTLIAMRPQRIVYVSCNPATLARDLALLEAGGFRTVAVQPVDMFPHTGHVEAVVLMSRLY
jgi:23S rRNA (uracil1939-C5)-methyltransferase